MAEPLVTPSSETRNASPGRVDRALRSWNNRPAHTTATNAMKSRTAERRGRPAIFRSAKTGGYVKRV
jgi:hypothetical protein